MSPIRGRSTRRSIYVFLALAALGAYAYLFDIRTLLPAAVDRAMLQSRPASGPGQKPVGKGAGLVPLEAHIMSKCPDARDCLRDLVLPAMQQVHDKVDFTLSYIGTPTENDGVDCKHGPAECLGNIIQLCALTLYPDPKIYLGFTMCLMRNYHDIPQRSLIEDCALEHAINFDKLNECATRDDGAFGIGLLRDSVKRSSEVRLYYLSYLSLLLV
ncbi:hypothetical protein GQ53DRAFT_816078 [Thozetella sp. PMI_491]|nr:hypothetical protein GQ53DRAFT_816078 [Thozetella sp. PMI_491]